MTDARAASKTALIIAAYRGRATARPDAICHDRWASALAGSEGMALAEALDRELPQRELWCAVRTAYLDGQVKRWTAPPASLAQVVLLGAGLDTRAERLGKPGVRFFEVDHPASQADKHGRLKALAGYPIDCAEYVACDFEKDDFLTRLIASGFRTDQPALILWEGVTHYLTEEAIRRTLRRIASGCHPATVLIFDHLLKKLVKAEAPPPRDRAIKQFVEDLGERFVFGTNDPLPMLYEEGFRHVRSLSFDEACLSLTGTYQREREFRFQRVVLASRTAPETD